MKTVGRASCRWSPDERRSPVMARVVRGRLDAGVHIVIGASPAASKSSTSCWRSSAAGTGSCSWAICRSRSGSGRGRPARARAGRGLRDGQPRREAVRWGRPMPGAAPTRLQEPDVDVAERRRSTRRWRGRVACPPRCHLDDLAAAGARSTAARQVAPVRRAEAGGEAALPFVDDAGRDDHATDPTPGARLWGRRGRGGVDRLRHHVTICAAADRSSGRRRDLRRHRQPLLLRRAAPASSSIAAR